MLNIKRDDKQYTDVEKFKLYELTHNICYEMAIRNDEVIQLVKSHLHNWLKEDMSKLIFTSSDLVVSKEHYNMKLGFTDKKFEKDFYGAEEDRYVLTRFFEKGRR